MERNKAKQVIEEVGKVILGKRDVVEKVFMAILSGGHILLEDVPGTGKTTLAIAFSKALGLDFNRLQFTSDTVPSDVIGFSIYNKETKQFDYVEGTVMTNLLLADEINRTSSKTQSALLEVMQEGNVTVDGKTHQVPQPFTVIATQNPVGSAGTQLLPQAQLDRFMISLSIGYPSFNEQVDILKDRHTDDPLDHVIKVLNKDELLKMQDEVAAVYISDPIYSYITELTQATRLNEKITLGMSPRGALAVSKMSRAYAYIQNRDYVIPEDVVAIFSETTAHRLILSPKAKITELPVNEVVNEVVKSVKMPYVESPNPEMAQV